MGYQSRSLFEIIEKHHENFNGSGYPEGLAGESIPLGARIVAVADAFAALTSWRPYSEKWASGAALGELEKNTQRGKFDPHVMARLRTLLTTG